MGECELARAGIGMPQLGVAPEGRSGCAALAWPMVAAAGAGWRAGALPAVRHGGVTRGRTKVAELGCCFERSTHSVRCAPLAAVAPRPGAISAPPSGARREFSTAGLARTHPIFCVLAW